jgi:hypothetical protein
MYYMAVTEKQNTSELHVELNKGIFQINTYSQEDFDQSGRTDGHLLII